MVFLIKHVIADLASTWPLSWSCSYGKATFSVTSDIRLRLAGFISINDRRCTTLRCLIKGYTPLFNFRNFDTLPSLIRVYPLIKFWKICLASPFFTFRNSRKCLPYPFIRYIFTLPFYLIFKNIPLYPLIRVYPFIRHLRVTPLSDQESSRVSMTSVEEPKGAELIFCKALATDALETGIILFKPLVCADFRPHPHAHRTPTVHKLCRLKIGDFWPPPPS